MNLTRDQINAIRTIMSGENVVLLGASGTGKSTVIREVTLRLQRQKKRVMITASTGSAASLINGRTIHSVLRTRNGNINTKTDFTYHTSNLRWTDVLIVDEVSMLNSQMVSFIAHCLMHTKRKIQLIFVGDFLQLRPVMGKYAFESNDWKWLSFEMCELTQVVRQDDQEFKENLLKVGRGDTSSIAYFQNRTASDELDAIYLCSRNEQADIINKREISKIVGREYIFQAEYEGEVDFSHLQISQTIVVKESMRVMTVINNTEEGYQNGSLGTVVSINNDAIEVQLDTGELVTVRRAVFDVDMEPDETTKIQVLQMPIRPAYAISIHKSQGMTFDKANIYAGSCWTHGQLYVALSRVKVVNGIHLMNEISYRNYIVDPKVIQFYQVNSIWTHMYTSNLSYLHKHLCACM